MNVRVFKYSNRIHDLFNANIINRTTARHAAGTGHGTTTSSPSDSLSFSAPSLRERSPPAGRSAFNVKEIIYT